MNNGPKSVGIIMDGNRRYARVHGLPTIEGHRQGAEKLRAVLGWAKEEGVGTLIVYAFSTENWKRTEAEVAAILSLFRTYLSIEGESFTKSARLRFIGERDQLPRDIVQEMDRLEKIDIGHTLTLVIAMSYGGRAEIAEAAETLRREGVPKITEELLTERLYTVGIPDPDLIIRTGGDERLSNFLPWQSVYSELIFTPTLWPAYTKEEFLKHLETYRMRKRNFGT